MYTVKQILQNKGHDVWTIAPDATVFQALEQMAAKDVGALLVLERERLIGIFSERDYARKLILHGKTSHETLVSEVMTSPVTTVSPSQSTEACMALMTEQRIRHLPVVDAGKLVGVISIGDVVKAVISNQEFVIAQMENYISGKGKA